MGDHAMSALLARNWWALGLRGAAAVLLGILALVLPGAAMVSMAVVFGAYLLVDGGFAACRPFVPPVPMNAGRCWRRKAG
jgi:uncharacterized membrane protein HdeD (DUF308 family)